MCTISWPLTSFLLSILNSLRNLSDTEIKASSGQGKNQSIAQVEKSEGNFYALTLNLGETGEKQSTVCKWSLQRLMK